MKKFCWTLLLLGIFQAPAAMSDETASMPELSLDGLEVMEKTRWREVYVAPGVDWAGSDRIIIDDVDVSFRKNWLRDQNRYQTNRIREADMDRIRNDMARMFKDALTAGLTENDGFELAAEAGENVLRFAPRVVDLDVYAPDPRSAPGIQRSYTETAGRMTLEIPVYDALSGDLVAVVTERQEAPRRGYFQWANTVSNNQEFRIMLKAVSRELRGTLDDLRSQ